AAGATEDPKLFARMPVRGLTPEQLFDSVAKATGFRDATPNAPAGVVLGNPGPRAEFLSRFGTNPGDKTTDHQTSILQALALMNGKLVGDATNVDKSETLAGILNAPFLDTNGKIEALYLAALSRRPTEKETARIKTFIDEVTRGAT